MLGGCYCGWIRYQATDVAFHETSCHCSICRRSTGAPYLAWFNVRRSGFRLAGGEPARFRATPKASRSFCPRCGTHLTYEHDDFPDEIALTTCSLDHPNAVPPHDHTHTGSKVGWVRLCDQLPQYAQGRDNETGN